MLYSLFAFVLAALVFLSFMNRRSKKPAAISHEPNLTKPWLGPSITTPKGEYAPFFRNGEKYYRNISDGSVATNLMVYALADDVERLFMNDPENYVNGMTFDEATVLSQDNLDAFMAEEKEADNWILDDLVTSKQTVGDEVLLPCHSFNAEEIFRSADVKIEPSSVSGTD